eukprot:4043353-Prymnesium_polylepis.1
MIATSAAREWSTPRSGNGRATTKMPGLLGAEARARRTCGGRAWELEEPPHEAHPPARLSIDTERPLSTEPMEVEDTPPRESGRLSDCAHGR